MKLFRRSFLTLLALTAADLTLNPAPARAEDPLTLRVHHFLSPRSNDHTKHLMPWAESVMEASNGRLNVEVYPAMQLGGAAPNLVQQLEDGVVDIIYTVPGYTPKRFPVTAGLELPFIGHGSEVMSQVAMDFLDQHMKDEYEDFHVISIHSTDPATVHSASKPIRTAEDFKGQKLRVPSRHIGLAVRELGGVPASAPLPQVYEALSRGQIDGMLVNWGVITPFKLNEVTEYHTDVPFYNTMLVTLMNRDSLAKLPEDLQRIIVDHSGPEYSRKLGAIWDEANANAKDATIERGNEVIELSAEELERWKGIVEPAVQAWAKDMTDLGMDGETMLTDLRALAAKYQN